MLDFLKPGRFAKKNEAPGRLFALDEPKSPVVEAFRTLRTNIAFASVDSPIKTILIASSAPKEGKSTVTANLGMVMAQAGAKVLVVDADLRKPTQHHVFGLDNSRGLVNAILQGGSPGEMAQEGPIGGLYIMTSGPVPPNPAELLASNRMAELLSGLREQYDLVLIDSPPTIAVTDSVLLASRVDGVAMVVRSGVTRIEQVNNAMEQLKRANERFLGVILNQVNVTTEDYRYYYYKKPKQRFLNM